MLLVKIGFRPSFKPLILHAKFCMCTEIVWRLAEHILKVLLLKMSKYGFYLPCAESVYHTTTRLFTRNNISTYQQCTIDMLTSLADSQVPLQVQEIVDDADEPLLQGRQPRRASKRRRARPSDNRPPQRRICWYYNASTHVSWIVKFSKRSGSSWLKPKLDQWTYSTMSSRAVSLVSQFTDDLASSA